MPEKPEITEKVRIDGGWVCPPGYIEGTDGICYLVEQTNFGRETLPDPKKEEFQSPGDSGGSGDSGDSE